jgi:hypothetical protein
LALQVAQETGGSIEAPSGAGYKVLVPFGRRGLMIRIMEPAENYPNGYYRISIPGKSAYTVEGDLSTDLAEIHIPIEEGSLVDILNVITIIEAGG